MTFFDRFSAANSSGPPLSLQLVFPEPLPLDSAALSAYTREYHPEMAEAIVELLSVADFPQARELVSDHGPAVAVVGLISWGAHVIKLAGFDAPMPYGPIDSCVVPALMPPEVKEDAAKHASHVLLYHAGPEPDVFERYLALTAVSGVLAQFGATAVLNEEARTACPAFDLIPEPGEDAFATIRSLPILYLFAGFVRTNVGAPDRPWIRTYGNHHLGLPDLAYQTNGYHESSTVFGWFNAMLGYLRETSASFLPGQVVQFDAATKFLFREPQESQADFLHSDGTMVVLERIPLESIS